MSSITVSKPEDVYRSAVTSTPDYQVTPYP
jgi:hypothetical protein